MEPEAKPQEAAPDSDEQPKFDVFVRVPEGTRLEDVRRRAVQEAGIAPDKVNALIRALQSVPYARIGAGVSLERAEKAKRDFSRTGLEVEINPLLTLAPLAPVSGDELFECPACGERVMLPPSRQCPHCGVFVDKVGPEAQLKRKILEQERERIEFQAAREAKDRERRNREQLEAAIRKQIRDELEEQYGMKEQVGLFTGRAGLLRAVGAMVLTGAAFGAGRWTAVWDPAASSRSAAATREISPQVIDKMLDRLGPQMALGAVGGTAAGPMAPEESLVRLSQLQRASGQSLSIEQVVASQMAQQSGLDGFESSDPARLFGQVGMAKRASESGAPEAAAAPSPEAAASAVAAVLPPGIKLRLSLELALKLAELGQLGRAEEIMTTLRASPLLAGDAELSRQVRLVEVQVQAWALEDVPAAAARARAEALRTDAAGIANPADRVVAFAKVGAILAQHPQLPEEVSLAFFTLAGDTLKLLLKSAQHADVADEWLVAMGDGALSQLRRQASTGRVLRVQALAERMNELSAQANSAFAGARLSGALYLGSQLAGQYGKAEQVLAAGLSQVARSASGARQLDDLRGLLDRAGARGHDRVQALVQQLGAQAEAKKGVERAQMLAILALIEADSGLEEPFQIWRKKALQTPGLSPAEQAALSAQLAVRGELALGVARHRAGHFAEADQQLQKVAAYLL